MKTSIHAILAAVCLSILFTACGPKTVSIDYYVTATDPDTLRVEWQEFGQNVWQTVLVPDSVQDPQVGNPLSVQLFGFLAVDPDDLDDFVPSQQFNDLRIFLTNGQQDSLIYEGIDDDDWPLSITSDTRYFFVLNP